MGSTPSPPPVPDPYATSAAQQTSNVNTAIANTAMGNANQVTPYGTIKYNQTGSQQVVDSLGNPISVPTYTVTQTPAEAQQKMLDLQNQTGISMDQTALNQAQQIGGLLAHPVSAADMPGINLGGGGTPSLTNVSGGPGFQTPTLQGQTGTYTPTQSYAGTAVNPNLNTSGVSGINSNLNLQTGLPNAGSIQGSVAGLDTSGLAGSNRIQSGLNTSGLAGQQNIQGTAGTGDYSKQALDVQNAMLARLSPQIQFQKQALENQLTNEGFQRSDDPNSAWGKAMDEFNRQSNDEMNQTMLAGYQEQQQLAGLNLQQGQFANTAQQQAYNEALGKGQFANTAQQQAFNEAATKGQFGLAQGQYGLTAQQQAYNQALSSGQFGNTAALGAAQYNLGAQGQQFQQALASGNYQAAATAANNSLSAAQAQFMNTSQAQTFAQDQAQTAFNNTVSTQGASAANAAAQQAYQNAMSTVQANNASSQQMYNDALAAMQAANQAQAQQYQQTMQLQSAPINNITALMSGGQVAPVQGAPYTGGVVQPTNVSGNVYNSAALAQQNYQNQLAQQSAQQGGMFGVASAGLLGGLSGGTGGSANSIIGQGMSALPGLLAFSDRRLKRDIIDTGLTLPNGLTVYAFKYIFDDIPRIGLMADEVREVRPDAVIRLADGYDRVDYSVALT